MKVGITLNDELLKRMDNYAKENYMTRSGLISVAVRDYLNSTEASLALVSLSHSMRKIASTGKLDKATKKQLEDFYRLASLLAGGD